MAGRLLTLDEIRWIARNKTAGRTLVDAVIEYQDAKTAEAVRAERDPQAEEFSWYIEHGWTPPEELERKKEEIRAEVFDEIAERFAGLLTHSPVLNGAFQLEERVCGECEGEGEVLSPGVRPRAEEDYAYFEKIKCPTCNGTGKLPRLTIRDAIERCRE